MKPAFHALPKVVLIGLLSPAAYCGDTTGFISELLVLNDYPDRVFVRVAGANSNLPACNTSNNRYVFDSSTTTGKQIYAALLAAKHMGASVTVHGFHTCNLVSNAEDLRGVRQN